ncbi:hypothetical protein RHGRI_016796 [Rhododendron griersonianum]|uniref:OTU domain-containing protein n=1 Tax=Rhododendron griersonianum TaxID=479676 RepID=A0AAV6JVI1_9ERIC|nr:hypothetical protein RHGRI_016796 [Rhododendron griersonianum]
METSIASSPSIDKQEIVDSSIHHDLELEDHTMEVEKQVTDVVVTEQNPLQEGDTSTLGSYVGPSTIHTSTCPPYDYTEHFTTEMGSEKCIKNRTPKMRFSCGRSSKYRPFVKKVDGKEVAMKKRVRSTGTKKGECPFELKAVKGNDGWTISVHNGTHNHPPAVYLEGYSEILTHLKVQDPENVTFIKTVYNVRQKYRVIEKTGKSKMQHLLDQLEKYKYVHWTSGNKTANVTELFWSLPSAGEMLHAFPRVLEKLKGMMDPNALPSVIVTDRELALINAITNVYPHATNLLCRWHISKNVLAKCKKMFDDKMWEEFICSWGLVVLSASVAQYEERLCVLKCDFEMVPVALEYVEKNWLVPYKERWQIPLPIELIHGHWKRLSLLAPRNEGSMEETLLAHFDCFYNKFLNEDQYDVKFPEAIRPYIESVKDVEDDGNCGFRAVSGFMKSDVHEWLMVRSDLLKELETHLHLYEQVVGGTQRARELLHILSWYESPAPQEYWMTMPDMGHIIASA